MNKERLQSLARDLRKNSAAQPPPAARGFRIAARMLDKARADLLGIHGEYNFYPCGLGAYFWKFTGLDAMKVQGLRGDRSHGRGSGCLDPPERHGERQVKIIRWNNEMIGLRLTDLADQVQEYFETYIPQFCNRPARSNSSLMSMTWRKAFFKLCN